MRRLLMILPPTTNATPIVITATIAIQTPRGTDRTPAAIPLDPLAMSVLSPAGCCVRRGDPNMRNREQMCLLMAACQGGPG